MTTLERKVDALIDWVTAEDEQSRQSVKEALKKIASANKVEVDATLTIKEYVEALLTDIGVPCNIRGYDYLTTAVCMSVKDNSLLTAFTYRLYPEIARIYGTRPNSVERSIRYAVQCAWDRCDVYVIDRYFGHTVSPRTGYPTNSAFISRVVREVGKGKGELYEMD